MYLDEVSKSVNFLFSLIFNFKPCKEAMPEHEYLIVLSWFIGRYRALSNAMWTRYDWCILMYTIFWSSGVDCTQRGAHPFIRWFARLWHEWIWKSCEIWWLNCWRGREPSAGIRTAPDFGQTLTYLGCGFPALWRYLWGLATVSVNCDHYWMFIIV